MVFHRRTHGPSRTRTGTFDAGLARREQRLRSRGWALRMSIMLAVVVLSGVVDPAHVARLGLLSAAGWAPVAGVVDALRRRSPGLLRWRAVSAAVDGGHLLAVVVLVPEALPATLAGLLLLTAYYLEVLPGRAAGLALVSTAIATGMAVLVAARTSADGVTASLIGPVFALAVVGLAWLSAERNLFDRGAELDLVAEQKRSGALLSGVGEAVVVTGAGGRIRRQNRGAELTLGSSSDVAVGGRCHDVLGLRRELMPLDCSRGCPLLPGEVGSADHEVWRLLPSGQRQPLLVTAIAVRDAGGATVEVMHSFRDITQLKRADEAKTLFLATASHELKTPLTVIRGFAELIGNRPGLDDEAREEAIRTIKGRALELSDIVDRLLLSAKIEAGTVEVTVEPAAIAERLRTRVTATATARERIVELVVPDDVPTVLVSPKALDTVIDHLLENALKYSPGGSPVCIEVGVEDDWVTVAVRDQGIGMSALDISHCFERFWQAGEASTRQFGGTGIGLYIVKSLVDAMQAEVEVTSVLGEGTCFTLRLRRRAAVATSTDLAPARDAEGQRSMIDEFMRQVGVGETGRRA